jgi:SET domain-containing protein|tara:strand:- start:271 stop:642 length:372 start_codon:yes stop_codon:yes gene_type:complete
MYKPLPKNLTIKKSKINGLGVFATEDIKKENNFGVSHIKDLKVEDGYWRTPLGGFINHSTYPNCKKSKNKFTNNLYLKAIRDIKKGEELTVYYTLYHIESYSEKMQDELERIVLIPSGKIIYE